MKYAKRIVLYCPIAVTDDLETLVENLIRDGVSFIGVVGPNSSHIEDLIDEIVVGDGGRDYDLLTSSHPNETIEEALEFARSLTGEFEGEVQLIELAP